MVAIPALADPARHVILPTVTRRHGVGANTGRADGCLVMAVAPGTIFLERVFDSA